MKRFTATLLLLLNITLGVSAAPFTNANIERVSIVLENHATGAYIYYATLSSAYSVKSSEKRIKHPVLAVYILYEGKNGVRICNTIIATSSMRGNFPVDRERIIAESMKQTEVETKILQRISLPRHLTHVSSGFNVQLKILLIKAELFLNGVLVANYTSYTDLQLKQLDVPSDWYLHNKYPDKFQYN